MCGRKVLIVRESARRRIILWAKPPVFVRFQVIPVIHFRRNEKCIMGILVFLLGAEQQLHLTFSNMHVKNFVACLLTFLLSCPESGNSSLYFKIRAIIGNNSLHMDLPCLSGVVAAFIKPGND